RLHRWGITRPGTHPEGCIFFFQAEDGIRDLIVTGVQTCALPISTPRDSIILPNGVRGAPFPSNCQRLKPVTFVVGLTTSRQYSRSEERRVGKECRSRGGAWHCKKKSRVGHRVNICVYLLHT